MRALVLLIRLFFIYKKVIKLKMELQKEPQSVLGLHRLLNGIDRMLSHTKSNGFCVIHMEPVNKHFTEGIT
jgi:hypothetical protein